MSEEKLDTGMLAEVPEEERLDADGGFGSVALEGGDDADLADVYANPEQVPEARDVK